ncbi:MULTISPECIES: acyl-CoA thioesterase [Nostoc]|uniref:Acyl-CoA thioesterase n=2 Tax=Nostoc TaxID=1177 RepID=A0ABR8IJR9_9NOSO|nr:MULTISPECIES: thioesterase family protein [Nostoc]MBD2566025.1 acyl-CoA thioesterase [Nostoc linckia FACHB-391]MBD2651124.1 acyl-CoA thioesterase [Nostoc foliaceum FACHB-393]
MPKITFELQVYPFDIDFIGHVNNSVYIQWMEIGRTKLLEAIGMPIQEIVQQGFAPVLVETNIVYKTPLYLGECVQVEMWISQLKNASAIMQFCFYNQQRILAAQGWQKGLFVDKQTLRPRRLGSEERSLFLPYVHSSVDAQGTNLLISAP